MKKTIAAILALSFVMMSACGKMPEQTESLAGDTEAATTMTDGDTTAEESESETTTSDDSDLVVITEASTGSTTSLTSAHTTTSAPTGATTAAQHSGNSGNSGNTGNTGHSGNTGNSGSVKSTTKAASTTKSGTTHASTTKTAAKATTKAAATTKVTTTTETPTLAPTDPVTEAPQNDGVTKMVNNVMVVHSGTDHPRALEVFYGNYNTGTRYAQTLNSYKAALGDAVNVWCMVVPTSQAYYTPEDVAGQYGSQLDQYNNIAANLDGVIGVPVYETLDAHKDEPTYSRTDYHWQPLAAYYAAEQFAAYAGVPYAPLDTYASVTRDGYVGAFYRVNNVTELGSYPEQFTYYKPANLDAITCTYYNTAFNNGYQGSLFFENNSVNASYTVFVGSDECILETDTNIDNGRVLVIFKDSYGNALVPFLTQSFSKIYLCDFRYFDRNAISFIQEVGATDLLFAMSTVAVTTSAKVDKVANNLTK